MEKAYQPTIRRVGDVLVIRVHEQLEISMTPYMWEHLSMQYEAQRMWDDSKEGGCEYEKL